MYQNAIKLKCNIARFFKQMRQNLNYSNSRSKEDELELLEVKSDGNSSHKTILVLPKNFHYKFFAKNSREVMAKEFDELDERYNPAKHLLDELDRRYRYEDKYGRIYTSAIVTPEMASYFLFDREKNRNLNDATIHTYSEMMKRGEWTIDTEIKFDKDKKLIDGQHRLAAIITANIPIKLSILFGYDDKAQAVMDCGRARTSGEASKILGDNFSDKYYAIIRALYNSNQYGTLNSVEKSRLVYGKLTELIKRYKLGIEFSLQPLKVTREITSAVVSSAIVRAYYGEKDSERLRQFLLIIN
ncbi:MAG: hypothetical protein PUP93_33985, partial [Rhizonema sp. NSF051]|nr:hypothetical protein [Rhizonema sp. NSF051]